MKITSEITVMNNVELPLKGIEVTSESGGFVCLKIPECCAGKWVELDRHQLIEFIGRSSEVNFFLSAQRPTP